MVGDADAALGSLTWTGGLQAITQHGLQALLWHELPRKWLTDRRQVARRRFAGAVAGAGRAAPLGGDLPWAPDRRGAAGLRGRRPGGLPGVPPGAEALWVELRTCPGRGCGSPGAGDGRREAGAFVSVAAALELAVAAASCARRRGLVRGPAGGRPPAPGGCRAGAGWAELAGGGGGGPSGAVRGRAAVVRPGGRWSTRCFRGWPAGRCCRSRSRPARPMAPAIGGGDGEPGSASAPARRQLIFGPGSWRELAGGCWSHWNLWFCTVAVPGFDGDWARLSDEIMRRSPRALVRSGLGGQAQPSGGPARTACRRRSGCRPARG
jgi:hypothetical protein